MPWYTHLKYPAGFLVKPFSLFWTASIQPWSDTKQNCPGSWHLLSWFRKSSETLNVLSDNPVTGDLHTCYLRMGGRGVILRYLNEGLFIYKVKLTSAFQTCLQHIITVSVKSCPWRSCSQLQCSPWMWVSTEINRNHLCLSAGIGHDPVTGS